MCVRAKRYYSKHFGFHHSAVEPSSPFSANSCRGRISTRSGQYIVITGERHSPSAKPVQANLMSYLGTKHTFPSRAELQLQSPKSRAWMANWPYFTTVSVILSVQTPATFSAAVKLSACSSVTAPQLCNP